MGGELDLRFLTLYRGTSRKELGGRLRISQGSTIMVDIGGTLLAEG
jgi:hypothetical protein